MHLFYSNYSILYKRMAIIIITLSIITGILILGLFTLFSVSFRCNGYAVAAFGLWLVFLITLYQLLLMKERRQTFLIEDLLRKSQDASKKIQGHKSIRLTIFENHIPTQESLCSGGPEVYRLYNHDVPVGYILQNRELSNMIRVYGFLKDQIIKQKKRLPQDALLKFKDLLNAEITLMDNIESDLISICCAQSNKIFNSRKLNLNKNIRRLESICMIIEQYEFRGFRHISI